MATAAANWSQHQYLGWFFSLAPVTMCFSTVLMKAALSVGVLLKVSYHSLLRKERVKESISNIGFINVQPGNLYRMNKKKDTAK